MKIESYQKLNTTTAGIRYIENLLFPDVPVSPEDWWFITSAGDRYDKLSLSFYGTPEYWWVIAVANNSSTDSLIPEMGVQLRIPADPVSYVNNVVLENQRQPTYG